MEQTLILDWDETLQFANGNQDLATEILTLFAEQLASDRSTLLESFEQGDLATLRQTLHRFLGSCSYCKAPQFQASLENLSESLKASQPEIEKQAAFTDFISTLDTLKKEISVILQEKEI